MIRRSLVSLSNSLSHSTRLFSQYSTIHIQRRILPNVCNPSEWSYLTFSTTASAKNDSEAKKSDSSDSNNKSETTNKANDQQNSTSSFSLKNGNIRIRSVDFLKKVKEMVGPQIPDEEFIIPRSAFDALATEYDDLIDECSSFKDKYTRALADTENVRRRGQKQVEDAKMFAIQGFCKDLLEVADILDLAIGSMKKEDIDSSPQIKSLHEGVEMTRTVLEKVFSKHGLKKLSPEGEKFDPNLHEAVFQVPKDQSKYESGCVAQVMTIGYALQGRPIRAAKVGVVASP